MAYANAFVIKNPASIKFDDVEMKAQVWKFEVTVDQEVLQNKTFDGVDAEVDTPIYKATITCYNSRKAGAVVKALDTARAAGDSVEIVAQLKMGTGEDIVTVTVVPVAVGFGGEVGSWHQAEIELPVIDAPAYSTAA